MGEIETEPVNADGSPIIDETGSSVDAELFAELRPGAPPGWMADPRDDDLFRYWDGERWTGHERRYVRTSEGRLMVQSPPGYWDAPEYTFDADGWGFELGGGIARPQSQH